MLKCEDSTVLLVRKRPMEQEDSVASQVVFIERSGLVFDDRYPALLVTINRDIQPHEWQEVMEEYNEARLAFGRRENGRLVRRVVTMPVWMPLVVAMLPVVGARMAVNAVRGRRRFQPFGGWFGKVGDEREAWLREFEEGVRRRWGLEIVEKKCDDPEHDPNSTEAPLVFHWARTIAVIIMAMLSPEHSWK